MKKEFAKVFLVFALIILAFSVVGWMNVEDVKTCMESGNTQEVCYNTFMR